MMAKNPISLHLSDKRKKRLDALVAQSDLGGHGAQSEYLRSLIDQAAAENPEIDFEEPSTSITNGEEKYHPVRFEGLLEKEEVREILNTEKSPAIDPEHCPPAWEPREKSVKALLMAAHYRFLEFETVNIRDSMLLNDSVDSVIDVAFEETDKVKRYKESAQSYLDQYGTEPSNMTIIEGISIINWKDKVDIIIEQSRDERNVDAETINKHIDKGKKFKSELENRGEEKLISMVEKSIEKLQKEYNDTTQ